MKSLSGIGILFCLIMITSFHLEDDIKFSLGTKTCMLRTTIIKEGALTLVALHDNENTAVEAFHNWTAELNINLLELHQRDDRYLEFQQGGKLYEIDPNMIFTETGRVKTLRRNDHPLTDEIKTGVRSFADSLLTLITEQPLNNYVIAVHNNTPDNFSVLSYKNSKNATTVFTAAKEDPDDFFIVTDSMDFEYFKNLQMNVVLQSKGAEDDGSLSVYCQQNGIPYINIEAEHGHLNKQTDMIKAVYNLVTEKPK